MNGNIGGLIMVYRPIEYDPPWSHNTVQDENIHDSESEIHRFIVKFWFQKAIYRRWDIIGNLVIISGIQI